jgi:rod shape determining protein RodA
LAIRFRLPPIDVPLAAAALVLVGFGLWTVYSATMVPGTHATLWARQLLWAAFALLAAWMAATLHFRVLDTLAYPLYGISLVLLVLVLVSGTSALGARRWLDLGPIHFQPSEIAKIATVLMLARRFHNPKLDLRRFRHWFPPLLLTLLPFVLVAREPDLGTSLSFPVILVAMYFWAGMRSGQLLLGLSPVFNLVLFFTVGSSPWWYWGLLVALLVALVGFARPRPWPLLLVLVLNGGLAYTVPHLSQHLADYQKRRIETFLNPHTDRYGAGYQIIQSQIAIGSGGFHGKGPLHGTQKALAFLPMRHTDFIFSVVGEEGGFIVALTVVILYAVIILRGFRLAAVARDGFASLMAVGLVAAFWYQVMVNLLMTIGWAPVTGLPLPLLSYGGTALLVNGIQLGLLQNVALRRRES